MYIFKKESIENVGFSATRKQMADDIGISESYFSKVINNKRKCSKLAAYAITKRFNRDKEIEDFFERVD